LQEFGPCVLKGIHEGHSSPVQNILHFFVAYNWQCAVFAEKAGLCSNIPYDEQKKLVLELGRVILGEEGGGANLIHDQLFICIFKSTKDVRVKFGGCIV